MKKKKRSVKVNVIDVKPAFQESSTENEDVITSATGEFGKYQAIWCTLCALNSITTGLLVFSNKFFTYKVDYWCTIPEHLNFSANQWLSLSAPLLPNNDYDRCSIFNITYDQDTTRPLENTSRITCQSWTYDTSLFKNTVRERWDIVCQNEIGFLPYSTLSTFLYFAGNVIGVLVFGTMADLYGRKLTYQVFTMASLTLAMANHFVNDPWSWITLRFFCGATYLAMSSAKNVWQFELTSGVWRSRMQHWGHELPIQIGLLSLGGIVYCIPDMKSLEYVLIWSILPFVVVANVMDESPRWLLSKGQVKPAKTIVKKMSKMNGMPLDKLDQIKKSKEVKKGTFLDILKMKGMRRNLLVLCLYWFANSMGAYGLIFYTPSFDWNVYLVFIFPALINIPMLFLTPFLENK